MLLFLRLFLIENYDDKMCCGKDEEYTENVTPGSLIIFCLR